MTFNLLKFPPSIIQQILNNFVTHKDILLIFSLSDYQVVSFYSNFLLFSKICIDFNNSNNSNQKNSVKIIDNFKITLNDFSTLKSYIYAFTRQIKLQINFRDFKNLIKLNNLDNINTLNDVNDFFQVLNYQKNLNLSANVNININLSLENLNLTNLSELHHLISYYNNKFNVSINKNIKNLNLSRNNINSIEKISCFKNLKTLNLSNNFKLNSNNVYFNLKSLQSLVHLKKLIIKGYNQISKIEHLNNLTQLQVLVIRCSNISQIENLNDCKNLKILDLSFNLNIKKIENIQNLKKLKKLILYRCNLNKIENLDSNQNLQYLDLGGNNISKVENISHLKNLRVLYLDKNHISNHNSSDTYKDISISSGNSCSLISSWDSLKNLKQLSLGGNYLFSRKFYGKLPKFIHDAEFIIEKKNILRL
ncbi:L domain-like protein [Ascoidea rubescens DSM 1968]|uniref:L domain-like protein n=1 Tax=Ascoidea rubescens DSM 1968 TaxID=1344418 RepID=A0A1D2VGF8_9ASCO|nr:L domain-like protein [Ascoidea rubescens DSM 1968]ODV60672.1 L domain-like protein [Ascoidea rubescens DSM 1968]